MCGVGTGYVLLGCFFFAILLSGVSMAAVNGKGHSPKFEEASASRGSNSRSSSFSFPPSPPSHKVVSDS